jgi:hypothetical protein
MYSFVAQVASGAGAAYLSGFNPYAGAVIGGVSALSDVASPAVQEISQTICSRLFDTMVAYEGREFFSQFCITALSSYALKHRFITPYTGKNPSFFQTFFITYVGRRIGHAILGKVEDRFFV